ncbi:CaiB/BaiF CoA transferase family protein [Burkholderia vietnamiensis]|uniref:CaiB/BaiF CoA transferase family protein n=1 Tax=Burkholderia vietnamiensis TaxID=60552 RepID=UPI000841B2EA|nr:CaiB/BaiF CoA-transferase family protein [Burkholderia vietnamiensis]AOJ98989.1 carnitine dehydratase [Burkholderia vietnamiensis]AOK43830.1 carnitine dehydratase [Burkholderia vietnamiensis]MDN7665344.1 CaiB/BaiF CoA-transferase family protein [Burkholderia vietnamiensis]
MVASVAETPSAKPLAGVVVVSIEQALAAPLCTGRLAEMGARVIKIERAEGDFARGYDAAANGQSSYFVWTNRGKESVVLDFKDADDAALLHRLIAQADVFVQNLAPGALDRAGFGSEKLREMHTRLITCDISGYGTNNAASNLKAYDLLVQCESGLAGITGAPDACGRVGVSICDIGAGMNATIAVLSALALRSSTGKGSGVSVSLFDGAADWMTIPYVHQVYGNGAPTRQGLKHPSIAPYGAFKTNDGDDIVISIQNEREWRQFCSAFLQQPDVAEDSRFSSNTKRVQNREALDRVIAEAFARLDSSEALQRLAASNTAYGQVRSVAQMAEHPALRTWPMTVDGEELRMIAPAVRAPWDSQHFDAAPRLGEHTERIRAEFATKQVGEFA